MNAAPRERLNGKMATTMVPSIKSFFKAEETQNIFLQEPVLKLNVSQSQAAAAGDVGYILKNSLHDNVVDHKAFSNISKGLVPFGVNENVCKFLIEEKIAEQHNNNSGLNESFIITTNGATNTTPTKDKKASTPHRILCPSPEKTDIVEDVYCEPPKVKQLPKSRRRFVVA